MATSKEVRAWAAVNGHPELEGGRGQLGKEVWAEYEAAHASPGDDYGPGTAPDDFAGDGGDDEELLYVSADDPAPLPQPDTPDPPAAAGLEEERPGRPRGSRGSLSGWWRSRGQRTAGKPAGRVRRALDRVSVAPLIEETYGELAWASAGIPPLQRLLYAQAPIAGVVLDPVVKDTVVDRGLLQPAARNYERIKVGMALLGTPAALLAVLATAPQPVMDGDKPLLVPVLGPDGQPSGQAQVAMEAPTVAHQSAMLSLRYGVRAMADLAGGDALARVQQRAEENEARDDLVNDFIAFLLGMPGAPPDAADTAAREGRDAALRLAGAVVDNGPGPE